MKIDGPKTPPLPPELIVRPVATIFSRARVSSSRTPIRGTNDRLARHRQVGRHADRPPLHPAVAAGHQLRERQRQQPRASGRRSPA